MRCHLTSPRLNPCARESGPVGPLLSNSVRGVAHGSARLSSSLSLFTSPAQSLFVAMDPLDAFVPKARAEADGSSTIMLSGTKRVRRPRRRARAKVRMPSGKPVRSSRSSAHHAKPPSRHENKMDSRADEGSTGHSTHGHETGHDEHGHKRAEHGHPSRQTLG